LSTSEKTIFKFRSFTQWNATEDFIRYTHDYLEVEISIVTILFLFCTYETVR